MAPTGPILVTGGCGLLGRYIVEALLQEPLSGPITVLSRNPDLSLWKNVTCISGDVKDASFLERIFNDGKYQVVIHTASPRPMSESSKADDFFDVNVGGTKNLLEASKKSGSVHAFIFSSTVNVIQGTEHILAAENAQEYWRPTSRAIAYWRSKASAEKLILAANSDTFRTVALRPCLIIGNGDHALIPAQLAALEQGKTNIQLGDNKNLLDLVTGDNAARAHLLAMHALLDRTKANGQVAGEAFNVTDDNPMPFWDVARIIWQAAGDQANPQDVTVIPAWLANMLASVSQIAYRILFLGNRSAALNQHVVDFCTRTHTYDITKARRVLGYAPVKDTQQTLIDATLWEIRRREQETSLAKSRKT